MQAEDWKWHGDAFNEQKLVDSTGKIVGRVLRTIHGEWATSTGESYISAEHARKAVERAAAAIGEAMP